MLKETSIWSFFLSTQSSTAHLVPTKEVEISERIILGELTILPPFLALQLDVNALQAVKQDFNAELKKPMSKFATAHHMTLFGRPLWRAYQDNPQQLRTVAQWKIARSRVYNPKDKNQVFAALASRLCLDVCMDGREAQTLAHDAVNSHMRIVLSMESPWEKHSMTTNNLKVGDENLETTGERDVTIDNQNMESLGRMVTTTPSEPVVAEAIAEVLCLKTAATFNWASSITTLVEILLSRGMIEKGIKGNCTHDFCA